MHAFRSFLTLIVRSRKELPPGTRIHALLPQTVSVDGAVTDLPSVHLQLFNNESLHELARAAGFTFHRQAAGGCNSTACDLRIGTSKYTCATQFGREAPPLPLDSAACQRRHSATFCLALHHQQLWEVLRHRLKQLGSNETFRVSLPVYARSASPLNGACAAYPDHVERCSVTCVWQTRVQSSTPTGARARGPAAIGAAARAPRAMLLFGGL